MGIVFLGTPQFAVPSLEAMLAAGYEVTEVITQPDRPKGRKQELTASPVKIAALARGLPVYQPERIRRPEAIERLRALRPDVMIVVGYGQIIPPAILAIPPRGIINVHASLLPKLRGAAPVQWAIARGEAVTGVTTMKIDAGLDTGDMLLQAATPIDPHEDAVSLAERLAGMGAELLVETLDRLETITPEKQNDAEATLAPILKKEDGLIHWARTAVEIGNQIRGLQPWPGAYTTFRGEGLHIWKAHVASEITAASPGRLIAGAPKGTVAISCGGGTVLRADELQLEGRKRVSAQDFRNGIHLEDNEVLP